MFGEIANLDEYDNIIYKKIWIFPGNGRFALLYRYLLSALTNIMILLKAGKKDIIFYNFNNVFCLRSINLFSRILRKHTFIVCHNELEFIKSDIKKEGFLQRILIRLTRKFFCDRTKVSKYLHFIVLGDSIKESLGQYLSDYMVSRFISIDHPYVFKKVLKNDFFKTKENEINIGTIGAFTKAKGGEDFLKLFELSNLDSVNWSINGPVLAYKDVLSKLRVNLPTTDFLPINELQERISKLDYVIFVYPKDSYELTASGAIFEAINMGKPILAIRNSFFEYIFNKYGSFGYLFENIEELAKGIEDLSGNENFEEILDKVKTCLSPISLVRDFKNSILQVIRNK